MRETLREPPKRSRTYQNRNAARTRNTVHTSNTTRTSNAVRRRRNARRKRRRAAACFTLLLACILLVGGAYGVWSMADRMKNPQDPAPKGDTADPPAPQQPEDPVTPVAAEPTAAVQPTAQDTNQNAENPAQPENPTPSGEEPAQTPESPTPSGEEPVPSGEEPAQPAETPAQQPEEPVQQPENPANDPSPEPAELPAVTDDDKPPLSCTQEQLDEEVQKAIDKIITDGMTKLQQAKAVWDFTKNGIRYTGTSDKSDWKSGAYEGLTSRKGDCFTYYAVSRALLTALEIDNLEVTRVGGLTSHYWNLVNCGDGWYHFDATPRSSSLPAFVSFMFTDQEAAEYTVSVGGGREYYTFDGSLYPERGTGNPAAAMRS